MDLKAYFRKIRDAERSMKGEYQLVVSLPTPDGGKAGVITEVATAIASRLIVEAKARRADDDEAKRYREEQNAKVKSAVKDVVSQTIQTQLLGLLDAWLSKGTVHTEEKRPEGGETKKNLATKD